MLFVTVECQLINVAGIMKLGEKNHHFALIIVIIDLWKNQQREAGHLQRFKVLYLPTDDL